ncbi:gluzincin family metallopeptidase [Ferruginibacter profundus]
MKPVYVVLYSLFFATVLIGWQVQDDNWHAAKHKGYTLYYTAADSKQIKEYRTLIDNGMRSVKLFFAEPFNKSFNVFIHPNRQSLDSTWQKDWHMPDFKSECWMVASGIASRLDMIAPKAWDSASCEHHYAEREKTQQLITHELVHVFHGQHNGSPDFSDTEGIDWLVEGLAVYASGQCDAARIDEVKKAIAANTIPGSLDNFWTGKLKYSLSGTMVMFIDVKWGRDKLKTLLPFNKKAAILAALNSTEDNLLRSWKAYMQKL